MLNLPLFIRPVALELQDFRSIAVCGNTT